MCGRYTITITPPRLANWFHATWAADYRPRYNAAPTQLLPVLLNEGRRVFSMLRWGLIPSWAKDPTIGSRMINARAETLAEKPAFRTGLQRRRCLVPADGFYEWKRAGAKRTPMRIVLKSGEPFAFAGLWDVWKSPQTQEIVRTFTVITTPPNELVADIHNRMPAILLPEHQDAWLAEQTAAERWLELLRPYPAERMRAYAVGAGVNSARVDEEGQIRPAEEEGEGMLWDESAGE